MRRIPMNPVIDDRFFFLGYIFGPWRDPIEPLALLGVNDHLNETNIHYAPSRSIIAREPKQGFRGHFQSGSSNFKSEQRKEDAHLGRPHFKPRWYKIKTPESSIYQPQNTSYSLCQYLSFQVMMSKMLTYFCCPYSFSIRQKTLLCHTPKHKL